MSVRLRSSGYRLDIASWLLALILCASGVAFMRDSYSVTGFPAGSVLIAVIGGLPAGLARRFPAVAVAISTVGLALVDRYVVLRGIGRYAD